MILSFNSFSVFKVVVFLLGFVFLLPRLSSPVIMTNFLYQHNLDSVSLIGLTFYGLNFFSFIF